MIDQFLNQVYLHNRVADYLEATLVLLVGVITIAVFKRAILVRLKAWAARTSTTLDDFVVTIVTKSGVPLAYLSVLYLSFGALTLSDTLRRIIRVAGIAALTIIAIQVVVAISKYAVEDYIARRGEDASRQRALRGMVTLVRVAAWTFGAIFLLDNLGFKISAVIAGLGIGGVAVALAAQAILGDVFSYFSIMLDRPFEVGDFIVVGEHMGVVEQLGIKSTRISSLDGEQVIISNKSLTDSRVRNYKRMQRRRVAFRFGVTFHTSVERLREIPEVIAGIIRCIEGATFDRAHFFSFGDSSLVFEVVYYVESSDYAKYMDIQQRINLALFEELGRRKVEIAYPTRTLYLHQ